MNGTDIDGALLLYQDREASPFFEICEKYKVEICNICAGCLCSISLTGHDAACPNRPGN